MPLYGRNAIRRHSQLIDDGTTRLPTGKRVPRPPLSTTFVQVDEVVVDVVLWRDWSLHCCQLKGGVENAQGKKGETMYLQAFRSYDIHEVFHWPRYDPPEVQCPPLHMSSSVDVVRFFPSQLNFCLRYGSESANCATKRHNRDARQNGEKDGWPKRGVHQHFKP